jgi:hypothetical protein
LPPPSGLTCCSKDENQATHAVITHKNSQPGRFVCVRTLGTAVVLVFVYREVNRQKLSGVITYFSFLFQKKGNGSMAVADFLILLRKYVRKCSSFYI